MNRQYYHKHNHQQQRQQKEEEFQYHRKENGQIRFNKSTLYPISNREPVPLPGERDNRQLFVVICRNNPTHIVSCWNIKEHLAECDELTWRPYQFIPPPPQLS